MVSNLENQLPFSAVCLHRVKYAVFLSYTFVILQMVQPVASFSFAKYSIFFQLGNTKIQGKEL